jgi:hypothetical protein
MHGIANRKLDHLSVLYEVFWAHNDFSEVLSLHKPLFLFQIGVNNLVMLFLLHFFELLLGGGSSIHKVQFFESSKFALIDTQLTNIDVFSLVVFSLFLLFTVHQHLRNFEFLFLLLLEVIHCFKYKVLVLVLLWVLLVVSICGSLILKMIHGQRRSYEESSQ